MAARAQFEQIRKALPPGMMPQQAGQQQQPGEDDDRRPGQSGGMYL